jgi:hypothetical protein
MYKTDLQLLRRAREATLDLIGDLSDAQLQFVPARRPRLFELPFLPLWVLSPPGRRWSVGEVADHLILFEGVFRNDITTIIELKKAGRDPLLQIGFRDINVSFAFIPRAFLPFLELPVGLFSQIAPNALVEFLTASRVLPAQNPDIAAPRRRRGKDALRLDLRSSLLASEALFAANPDLDYRRMFRQHPTTGRQNVLEALRMIALHEQRHHGQIREILDDPAFPKS